jgi:hypothetical protein
MVPNIVACGKNPMFHNLLEKSNVSLSMQGSKPNGLSEELNV